MRLIGTLGNSKEADVFCSFLLREGIRSTCDRVSQEKDIRIWVEEEGDVDKAYVFFQQFTQNPQDPKFQLEQPTAPVEATAPENTKQATFRIKVLLKPKRIALSLTSFIIGICVFLFCFNSIQEIKMKDSEGPLALEVGFTPLEQVMIFDYPHGYQSLANLMHAYPIKSLKDIQSLPKYQRQQYEKVEAIPVWKGFYDRLLEKPEKTVSDTSAPLFEKIREGEIWRLFTPCLMHRGFLHILFNMAWVLILGRQIEDRIGKWRLLLISLVIGIVSNMCQYLMSGPFFLGYSGIVVGMAGFIWMRQRLAPWEGYPLQKPVAIFILVFVLAMFGLDLLAFFFKLFSISQLSLNVANTAHIVGGLCGLLLARLPRLSRAKVDL